MTSNADDRVSREVVLRALRVPWVWVRTFGWDRSFWANQENGQRSGPHWGPSQDDVERMLER
jgi:hypothetical protein